MVACLHRVVVVSVGFGGREGLAWPLRSGPVHCACDWRLLLPSCRAATVRQPRFRASQRGASGGKGQRRS